MAPALTALLAGEVDVAMADVLSALPHIRAGKLQAFAVTSKARLSWLPQTPTLDEAGLGGYEAMTWLGLVAPAGTPSDIVGRIHQALPLPRQHEVDDHRGPATQRRPGAALEIIRRVGAHEGHLQMRMRVDPAGHHIAASRIELRPALEALPDLGDHPVLDADIGLVGEVGGDDGAVLDDGGHWVAPSN